MLLLLAACDRPVTRSEAENIAEDFATDTSELESRIAELESEVSELREQEARLLTLIQANQRYNEARLDASRSSIDDLWFNSKAFTGHINALRQANGWGPVPEKN